jgi:Family of unknown function (DUF6448)
MSRQHIVSLLRSTLIATMVLFIVSSTASAHCDGMDGPVVKAARRALETHDASLVLIWVQKKDEAEVRQVFQATLAVRNLSPDAKELADRYFFETLVRLHRAGEGAPYTGLKPAGRDLGPAIPAADRALEEGSMGPLKALLTDAMQRGLREHYEKALTKKNFRADDFAAGREYVEAYVEFVHYVERIHEASTMPAQGHFHESGASSEEGLHAEHRPQNAIEAEAEHR